MAAKDVGTKVQLSLKAGNDLLNVYAVNARELDALVEEIVEVSPAIATRFGLTKSVAAAVSDKPSQVAEEDTAASSAPAAVAPTSAAEQEAPTVTSEGLSPREKARLRLKGAK